jgi:hypothetical protein
MREKLDRVRKNADGLLKSLGVRSHTQAPDGPGDWEVLEALVLEGDANEDPVIESTRRIGRLIEIVDATEAACDFERRARIGDQEVAQLAKLTGVKGHSGDTATNEWVADAMSIYKSITGKRPATSVGATGRNEGVPGGPLIRFLQAAGKPLGIQYSTKAWRSRVRAILKRRPSKD